MKKVGTKFGLIALGIVVALSGGAVAQSSAPATQVQVAVTPAPVPPPAPAGTSLAPPVATGAQQQAAINALQTQQVATTAPAVSVTTTTTTGPAAPAAPAAKPSAGYLIPAGPGDVLPSAEGKSADTVLREIARFQAQLALLKAAAEVQKQDFEIRKTQMEFEKDAADNSAATTSTSVSVSGGPVSTTVSTPAVFVAPEPTFDISVSRVYGYAGKQYAEIFVNGLKFMASNGTVLPSGDRVVAISAMDVTVVSKKGKRRSLMFGAPVASGSTGVAGSSSSPYAAPRSPAPNAANMSSMQMPPLPPSM